LLVCDFGLPDGTGADVMRYVREHRPIKGIAITGFGQEEDIRRSREAGFSVHLTKPVSIDMLQSAIDQTAGAMA
jgi:CheY-like chemotaxis protein